jgi:hypothetical protein
MPTRILIPAVFMLASLVTACASTGQAGHSPRGSWIAQEEIAASTASTAYELIQSVRPRWLNDRGQATFGLGSSAGIMVYVDGVRMGMVDSLHQVSLRDLKSAQRLSSGEATQRFGGGHPHGAILLVTR